MKILLAALFGLLTINLQAQTNIKTYKVSVAFNSIGMGVPDEKPLVDYIKKFKKTNKIKFIAADRIGPLGREGEYKLGFSLKELKKAQQAAFIKGLKVVVSKMKDRGIAEVAENDKVDFDSIGRGGASAIKF